MYNKNYQNIEFEQSDTEAYNFARDYLKVSPSNIAISSIAEPIDLEILFDDFTLQEESLNLLLILDVSEYENEAVCPCLGGRPIDLNAQIGNVDYQSINKNAVLFLIGGNYQYSKNNINVYNLPAEASINNKQFSSIEVLSYLLKKTSVSQSKVYLSHLVSSLSLVYDTKFKVNNDFLMFNLSNKLSQDVFTTSDFQIHDEMTAEILAKEMLEKKKSEAKKQRELERKSADLSKKKLEESQEKKLKQLQASKQKNLAKEQQVATVKPVTGSRVKKSKPKIIDHKSLSWLESECMLGNVRTKFDSIKLQANDDINLIKNVYKKSMEDFSKVKMCSDKNISKLSLADATEFKFKLKVTELNLSGLEQKINIFEKELQLKIEAKKLKDKKQRNATSFSF